jgi:hypothetical protein
MPDIQDFFGVGSWCCTQPGNILDGELAKEIATIAREAQIEAGRQSEFT